MSAHTVATIGTGVGQGTDATTLEHRYIIRRIDTAAFGYAEALTALTAVVPTTTTVSSLTLALKELRIDGIQDGGTRAWEGAASYSSETSSASFVALDLSTSALTLDVWRVSPSAPGDANAPADADIGGTKVDQGGEPITTIAPQQELTIVNYLTHNNAVACRNAIGKRNSDTFVGAAPGYLLFTGASAKRVGVAQYEVTYRMTFDVYSHCRQVPVREVDGRIKLETSKAKLVYWRQPFGQVIAFSGIGINTS